MTFVVLPAFEIILLSRLGILVPYWMMFIINAVAVMLTSYLTGEVLEQMEEEDEQEEDQV
jgi:hypothetical protein